MRRVVIAIGLCVACRTPPTPAPHVGSRSTNAAPAAGEPVPARSEADSDTNARCYPYKPRADRSCPTECATIEDCQGSRGPSDLAEHGWPLDCIQRACVPLPPDHVTGAP